MQTRTLYALLAAALMLPLGSVAAESPIPELRLKLDPYDLTMCAGQTRTVTLYIHSPADTTATITTKASEGLSVLASSSEVRLHAYDPARLVLSIGAREPGTYTYGARAESAMGATGEISARVDVRDCERPTTEPVQAQPNKPIAEPATDRPMSMKPRPTATSYDARILAILDRIDRILAIMEERQYGGRPIYGEPARPAHLAPIHGDPAPPAEPRPIMPVVSLELADESVDVGSEGRRVALLVQGRDGTGRVPLHVRVQGDTGWRAWLEQDSVFVRDHERTWVWLHLSPGETFDVEYVVQAGDSVAKGVAHFTAPHIA